MMKRSRNVVYLPEELILEILLRLTVKALLRFKCVCKKWCALIGSRSFINDHYGLESNPHCHLIKFAPTRTGTGPEFSVCGDDGRHLRSEASSYLSQMRSCTDLLGPANGIFCAVSVLKFKNRPFLTLLNPATRKLKPLPPIPFPLLGFPGVTFAFGFYPLSGGGGGDGDGVYKVAAFLQTGRFFFFSVYNSSTDSWSEVFEGVDESVYYKLRGSGVFLNGVWYWFRFRDNNSVLGLDMRSENFHDILVPDAIRDADFGDVDIAAYDDSLALLHEKEGATSFDFWVLETRDGEDGLWTKRFSFAIDLPLPLPLLDCYTVFVWNKNELLFDSKTETRRKYTSSLFLYDISTQKLRKFGPEFHAVSYDNVYSYKESLVSIQGETDTGDFVHRFFKK